MQWYGIEAFAWMGRNGVRLILEQAMVHEANIWSKHSLLTNVTLFKLDGATALKSFYSVPSLSSFFIIRHVLLSIRFNNLIAQKYALNFNL